MSREWKPGDVVAVRDGDIEQVALVVADASERLFVETSAGASILLGRVEDDSMRPLVVIDPEDRANVERLRDLWDDAHETQEGYRPAPHHKGKRGSTLQAALRSLVAPPKPDEPSDVTAIVVDSGGYHWARGKDAFWYSLDGLSPGVGVRWARVDAVRVLSQGVA